MADDHFALAAHGLLCGQQDPEPGGGEVRNGSKLADQGIEEMQLSDQRLNDWGSGGGVQTSLQRDRKLGVVSVLHTVHGKSPLSMNDGGGHGRTAGAGLKSRKQRLLSPKYFNGCFQEIQY